ncbi:MAG: hypothetical protein IKX48_00270 [Victivallales bacterium]|nr:hypothetical protein [Victivallales bacterium]
MILAVYHPYPDFRTNVQSAIRPLPGYDGWVDSRMERDMQRMRGVGIDGVLLSIKPEDLADNVRFSRIRRFYELASVQQPVFKVALMMGGNNELSIENVSQFIYRKGLADIPSAYKLNGKTVLVFDKLIRLVHNDKKEEKDQAFDKAFCFRQIGKNWPNLPDGKNIDRPLPPDGFVWVRTADNHESPDSIGKQIINLQDSWILPRGNGRNFANRLRHALNDKASIICIQSWNDFSDGSFMEPNTLDRNLMMTVLQKELSILAK